LTAAIIAGGDLDPLVAALATYEQRRKELEARRASIQAPRVDLGAARRQLEGYLVDWRKLLSTNVQQGQQVLRRLIKGRLTFAPREDGNYAFSGTGSLRLVLGGLVHKLASQMFVSSNPLVQWLRELDHLMRGA
jgi:hypothetical protein